MTDRTPFATDYLVRASRIWALENGGHRKDWVRQVLTTVELSRWGVRSKLADDFRAKMKAPDTVLDMNSDIADEGQGSSLWPVT